MQRYRALFATSHLAGALTASIIGRLPISITGFAILLHVQAATGSFERAGTLTAIYIVGLAVVAPFLGRLIDRLGPRLVLVCGAIAYPAALVVLVALVSGDSIWTMPVAALAGASLPPITVCMRALYPQLLADELLTAAYSLDAALIEAIFIVGPLIVSAFAAYHYPQGAILFAAFCASSGSVLFLRSHAVRQWVVRHVDTPRAILGPLRERELSVLFLVTLVNACAFGLVEIAITGRATDQGYPAAAGILLGMASVGTTLGVLLYGSRSWRPLLPRQYFYTLLLQAAGILVIAPVENLFLLGGMIVIACVPMSVALAITSLLISKVAPRPMLAESFTWMATSLLTGISAGFALGGVLLEKTSASTVLTSAAALAASAAGLVRVELLRRAG